MCAEMVKKNATTSAANEEMPAKDTREFFVVFGISIALGIVAYVAAWFVNLFFFGIFDGRGFLVVACHIGCVEIHVDQLPVGCAGSNGIGHCRRDLSHQRVGKGYPHRANDALGSPAGNNDRVFPGRHPVRTGTHHALCRGAVGPDGHDLHLREGFFDAFHQPFSKLSALTVNYKDRHIKTIPFIPHK